MTAAIQAKRANRDARVLVLEKNSIPGRKLRATGNGRCNLTNSNAREYLKSLRFLSDMGIAVREYPEGYIYPYSESAADVAEVLKNRMDDLGVELLLDTRVTGASTRGSNKVIEAESAELGKICVNAQVLIISAGGKAGPAFGTTGDGTKIAAGFGHRITKLVPVLTAVEVSDEGIETLAGIRARGSVKLYKKGRKIFEEPGEIQFTKTGLSGICIFNMTRHMIFGEGETIRDFGIGLDLCHDFDMDDYITAGVEAIRNVGSDEPARDILRTFLKKNLASYVITRSGVDPDKRIVDLSAPELYAIIAATNDLRFKPEKLKGWRDAQCTSGGVDRFEVDDETCQSLLVPSLYMTGEVLDYDGPCGGYNLNFAWLTGMAAGESAGRSIKH